MDPIAGIKIRADHCKLTWDNNFKTIRYHEVSKLSILYTAPGADKVTDYYTNIHNKQSKTGNGTVREVYLVCGPRDRRCLQNHIRASH